MELSLWHRHNDAYSAQHMNYKCKMKAESGRPNVKCACVDAGGERNTEAQDENLRHEESREARRELREDERNGRKANS